MKTKTVFSLVSLLVVALSHAASARGGGGGFGGGGAHFGGAEEADMLVVVLADFIAPLHFTAEVLEDFATRSARGRPTDGPFTCARKVRSQDRQLMHPCLGNHAVPFLPLAIARQGRRRRRTQSRLTQRCGQARMRGITSLHEKMGVGIAIGIAAALTSGMDGGGPGTEAFG